VEAETTGGSPVNQPLKRMTQHSVTNRTTGMGRDRTIEVSLMSTKSATELQRVATALDPTGKLH